MKIGVKEMNYKMIKKTSTPWGVTEKVYASFSNKTDAVKKLDDLYGIAVNNRRFAVSYVEGDYVKSALIEQPKFTTIYTIVKED